MNSDLELAKARALVNKAHHMLGRLEHTANAFDDPALRYAPTPHPHIETLHDAERVLNSLVPAIKRAQAKIDAHPQGTARNLAALAQSIGLEF